jgi:hypothetical protein
MAIATTKRTALSAAPTAASTCPSWGNGVLDYGSPTAADDIRAYTTCATLNWLGMLEGVDTVS